MTRNQKEKITRMLKKSGIEVVQVRRNKALIRVPSIHNQPAETWIDLKTVDANLDLIA